MKTASFLLPAAAVSTLGLLAALAGSAATPTRVATIEANSAAALIARADGNYQAPVPVNRVPPVFPLEMTRLGISEVVNVDCLIYETGRVLDPKVEGASNSAFAAPALAAIRKWTFKPALRDGVPVAQRVIIPLNFTFD